MSLYWVNWIYMHDGKACHGIWSEAEIMLERAIKGVEWLKANRENLVCAWINRSEEQADGSHKNTGTPYLEVFVDAFGYPARETMKVTDECGEPIKPVQFKREINRCPSCGHIVEGEATGAEVELFPSCGRRIDWEGV